ncbi:penicillin acylase family protein [Sphingopyxis sp. CCNWLW253]
MPMTTAFRRPAPRCGSPWPRHSCQNRQSGEIILMRRSTATLLHGSAALLLAATAPTQAQEKVAIYRDDFGVPHVQAETSDAVMFGAGYAIAHDRLAAMELARHNTQGRRAELVGKSAIEGDKMMRGRRLSDAVLMQRYNALASEHQKMIQAMVDGINKRIDEVNADPAG